MHRGMVDAVGGHERAGLLETGPVGVGLCPPKERRSFTLYSAVCRLDIKGNEGRTEMDRSRSRKVEWMTTSACSCQLASRLEVVRQPVR